MSYRRLPVSIQLSRMRAALARRGRMMRSRPYSYDKGGRAMDMGQLVPQFAAHEQYCEIVHHEMIQDISSSTNFTNTVFPINPGLAATFPWLATLASNFEEYQFIQLAFTFKTTSALALNSTNTALGVVIGATNYNVTQAAFTTKQQMENYQYAKSAPPAVSQVFPVECDRRDNVLQHLYIRSGSLGVNQDLRFNDLGNFQLATVGSQATAVVGELWVSYRVRLYKPSLSSVGNSDTISCHYGPTAFTSAVVATVTASSAFGTSPPASTSFEVGSNLALKFTSNPNTITFPASLGQGTFILWICWKGASSTLTSGMSISATTNCTFLSLLDNSGVSAISQTSGTTANTRQYSMAFVSITGPSAVVTISAGTLPGTLTSVDVFCTALNPNILTKKQAELKHAVVRRADDPNYDPSGGKYIQEEFDAQGNPIPEDDTLDAKELLGIIKMLASHIHKTPSDKADSKSLSLSPDDEYVDIFEDGKGGFVDKDGKPVDENGDPLPTSTPTVSVSQEVAKLESKKNDPPSVRVLPKKA